ncbi:60Kd inner membrane protein-domain-containing protein [Umbelopsis sp. PMI_123]|nr:60Kd inner membrane protein-domain-containing protein [Umbelopsis sp. PMI_123]
MINQSSIRLYTTPTEKAKIEPVAVDSSVTTTPISTPDVTSNVADVVSNAPTSEAITAAAAQIGDFKAMGLCNYTPVGALEAALEAIHVSTGLPWWVAIAATTVAIRIAMIPLNIKVQRNNARVSNINPDLQRIMNNVNEAKKAGDQMAIAKYSQQAQQLFKDNDCHPAKSLLLPLVQAPVMISFFMALRAMAELPVPGFLDGGFAWFTDLSVKDPYYILPVLSSAGMLAILETGSETGAANPQAAGMKNFFRGMTVLMIPFTAWMPSSVFVYWVTNNIFSLGQFMALKAPSVRSALNIPKLVKPAAELQKNSKGFMQTFKDQTASYQKGEKERIVRERQQAAAMARRASKRRF